MSFKQQQEKQYVIRILSTNGNTVAFINLSNQFTKALLGKPAQEATFEEVASIDSGHFVEYLKGLEISLEKTQDKDNMSLEEF